MKLAICKRFYDVSTKLSAISIDGFKRERYVIKIQHMSDEILKAQEELELQEEEVESGSYNQMS